ncbi:pimeloyl-ACP methyl ester carboxylesterase [Pelomonas saccharophila]|uniref:Pimeloyl-ACP methyl ester carboxylesterase n=1 Tax=Roseateles saccharophilus TaxID=304 RepID=A0ABU1YMB5_ROSSA|nr:alpha/beta hydrolase [Roseateles saccharophilus]MDR7269360.1 pimeloyl-ACP methyl ester carboxylesterase [Roseateles saccharophilus]
MNLQPEATSTTSAPPLVLLGLEPLRAALEYARMRLADASGMPRGDGHAVIVFPGLASDRHATGPLTSFCRQLGYDAQDWGRGFNTGPQGEPNAWLDELADHVSTLAPDRASDLSLIGWSLGGIYAREVAKRLHARVRQVITIGTPFAAASAETHAGLVYRLLNGHRPALDSAMREQLLTAPEVPTTSVYSRTDGVVAWQACIQPGRRVDIENVEVQGSHCGLGWNTQVLEVVADRLSQPRGRWRPFEAARPKPMANAALG